MSAVRINGVETRTRVIRYSTAAEATVSMGFDFKQGFRQHHGMTLSRVSHLEALVLPQRSVHHAGNDRHIPRLHAVYPRELLVARVEVLEDGGGLHAHHLVGRDEAGANSIREVPLVVVPHIVVAREDDVDLFYFVLGGGVAGGGGGG